MTWTNLTFPFASLLTSTQMTQLDDNLDALMNKDAGAPVLTDSYIVQAMLNTGTSSATFTLGHQDLTLSGGRYSFLHRSQATGGNAAKMASVGISANNNANTAVNHGTLGMALRVDGGAGGGTSTLVDNVFINASAPWFVDDVLMPVFGWAWVDNGTGVIEGVCIEDAPTWGYNGPTDAAAKFYKNRLDPRTGVIERVGFKRQKLITVSPQEAADDRAKQAILEAELAAAPIEIEITNDIKNADMASFPHPWADNDLTGKTIVLFEPNDKLTENLAEIHKANTELILNGNPLSDTERIDSLILNDFIRIDNVATRPPNPGKIPPGILVARAKWRVT